MAARAARMRRAWAAGGISTCRNSLCAVSRRRPGVGDPLRHDHGLARAWQFRRPGWHRQASGRDHNSFGALGLGASGDRVDAPTQCRIRPSEVFETDQNRARCYPVASDFFGDRRRAAAMDELYGGFVRPGDLVFDIGAHVGDRRLLSPAGRPNGGARSSQQPAMAENTLYCMAGRSADVSALEIRRLISERTTA